MPVIYDCCIPIVGNILPDTAQLHIHTLGSGLPLLVLHGGPGWDHTYFRPWLDPLGDVAEITFFDLLGNGRSAEPDDWAAVTHETWAANIDALRIRLGHERIVLFGHSYGGFLALEYALRYDDHLHGLILCSTAPALDYPDTMLALARARSTPTLFDTLVNALSQPIDSDEAYTESIRTLLPLYFHRPRDHDMDAIVDAMHVRASPFNRGFFHCLPTYHVEKRLPEITVPSLVLQGRHDWVCPPEQGERLLSGMPNGDLHIFEHSGHFPFIEEPHAFTRVVSAWLRNVEE